MDTIDAIPPGGCGSTCASVCLALCVFGGGGLSFTNDGVAWISALFTPET